MRTSLLMSLWMSQGWTPRRPWRRNSDSNTSAEEVLELVGFDTEEVGLEAAVELDAVGDDLGRGPAGEVGLDVEDALAVDAEEDEGGVVAAAGVAALAGIEGEGL